MVSMNKLLKGALVVVALFFSWSTLAADFIEGQHYQVLQGDKSKQKEIREYFSFYCANCYSQESFMKSLAKKLPGRAKFVKNHVEGMPNKDPEIEAMLSKALIIAERMRIKDKVIDGIFKRIHADKSDFTSAEQIKELFLSFGVSEIMYDSTASSFTVDIKYNEMKQNTDIIRSQGHKTIPVLIVNGKYKPLTTRITSMAQYKELIYFLLQK